MSSCCCLSVSLIISTMSVTTGPEGKQEGEKTVDASCSFYLNSALVICKVKRASSQWQLLSWFHRFYRRMQHRMLLFSFLLFSYCDGASLSLFIRGDLLMRTQRSPFYSCENPALHQPNMVDVLECTNGRKQWGKKFGATGCETRVVTSCALALSLSFLLALPVHSTSFVAALNDAKVEKAVAWGQAHERWGKRR